MANGSSTTSSALLDCPQTDTGIVERVNYFPRQLLTADDMFADQDYFRLKLQRHNRFLHGWGTVCGLTVTAAPTTSSPWMVQISAGYALGPYGDEIYVGDAVTLDLASCGSSVMTNPCQPDSLLGTASSPGTGSVVYIAIEYSECLSRPISVTPSGCGCDQTACQNSRIRDSFQIQCLGSLPSSYQTPPSGGGLCDYLNGVEVPPCLPCPTDPWVVLAAVTLPVSSATQVANGNIDNFTYRRQILSTAVLQEQIAACCCGPSPSPTPTPTPTPPPPAPTVVQTISFKTGQVYDGSAPNAIKVTFSQPVLRRTVTTSTFFVTPMGQANVAGSISFDDNSNNATSVSATFTAPNGFPFSPAGGPLTYTVTLVGNPPSPILDLNNLALDGDGNGTPGGNYTNFFVVNPPVIQ